MVKYNFLERDPNLVDAFYRVNGLRPPKIYLIAVGAFEGPKLVELFTVSKPPKKPGYTFKMNSCSAEKHLKEMVKFFHTTYDGKIEGLD